MDHSFLRPECPWSSFEYGKVLTCEARLCGWVRQPLNTYSSLVFLVGAFFLLRQWRRDRQLSDLVFGTGLVFIGLSSVLNHASQIRALVSLDFLSIFLLASALFVMGLSRRGWVKGRRASVGLFLMVAALSAYVQVSNVVYGIPLAAGLALSVLWLEASSRRRARELEYGALGKGIACLLLGALCFYLDGWGLVCDPANHWFQLHAVWHVLGAIGLYCLALYYRQIYPRPG